MGCNIFCQLNFWGGQKLKRIQENDKIKNEYCKNNGVALLRIRYDSNIKSAIQDAIDNQWDI